MYVGTDMELYTEDEAYDGNTSGTTTFLMDYRLSITEPMYFYQLLQTGIILCTLVAGITCLSNLIFATGTRCKNFDLLLTSLVVGFLHMLTCVLMLRLSEDSALSEIPRGGNQRCIDYFPSAILSNMAVLVAICVCIIDRNVISYTRRILCKLVFTIPIVSGMSLLYRDITTGNNDRLHQEAFLTIDSKTNSQVMIFWSVCVKNISEEHYRLFIEYCLLYCPVLVVILSAWASSYRKNKGRCTMPLKIMATDCVEADDDDDDDDGNDFLDTKHSHISIKCFCSRLNSAFIAILVYFAVVLLGLRPAMFVYGYVTSGEIRDILPSLLQTVIYSFLCSEFLLRTYRQRAYRLRKQLLASSVVTKV